MEEQVAAEKTYRLGRAGRRMAYLLLAGAVLIWVFALWTLKNTLKLGFRPENLGPSLRLLGQRLVGAEGTTPLTPEETIPAVVMLVLLLVIPLLIWNIVEELRSTIAVRPEGIVFRSLGLELACPWSDVADLRPVDEESDEPLDELVLRTSHLGQIRNPLVRFLHWQAYGRYKLPLYGGLEEREDLIDRVRLWMGREQEHAATVEAAEVSPEAPAAEPEADETPTPAEGTGEPTFSSTPEREPTGEEPAG